jgi:hypothetical protein
MKKYLFIAVKTLLVLGVLVSIGLNAYFFGFVKLKEMYQKQGAEIVLSQIVQAVKQNGSIKIGDVNLMVVPAVKQEEPKE